jgi:hypothetical protein
VRPLVVALLGFVALTARAPVESIAASTTRATPESGCEIIDYGHYVPESTRYRFGDRSSVTGERFEISRVRFTKQTKTIAATLGQRFGISYRLGGLPQQAVTITWRIVYPSPVRGSKGWSHRFQATPARGELVQHLLYDFTAASEMVTGRWDFQVWVDGQQECSFAFRVQ